MIYLEMETLPTTPDTLNYRKRMVQFNPCVTVVLIPTISEYREAGIFENLWHTRSEMEALTQGYRKKTPVRQFNPFAFSYSNPPDYDPV